MARVRSQNRDKSFELYKENNGRITPKEIAKILNEKVTNIRTWKNVDKWDECLGIKSKKRGAPKGNSNAIGNSGGAPKENVNAVKHGNRITPDRFKSKKFLAKYIPKITEKIMDDLVENKVNALDMLWMTIDLQFAALLRSQQIMHVENKDDLTKELKKVSIGKINSEEYELQFAWDKQERFLKAQSIAMAALTKTIREYEELLNKNWDMATEEQKTRVETMKEKINLEKAKFAYDVQKDQGGNKDNELAKSVKAKMESRKIKND